MPGPPGSLSAAASTIRFDVRPFDGGPSPMVVPVVDGTDLDELVGRHETAAGYRPAGAYAGLVLDRFAVGDLRRHLLGTPDRTHLAGAPVPVLGCDCGEVGCWPLDCRIATLGGVVTWSGFGQPYRPEWSYAGFGPFAFDENSYLGALDALELALPAYAEEHPRERP